MSVSDGALRVVERPARRELDELSLVEALEAEATAEGISGVEQARQAGVDQAQFSRVRRGLERFGPEACSKLVVRYPHLRGAAARYLAEVYSPASLELLAEAGRVGRAPGRAELAEAR